AALNRAGSTAFYKDAANRFKNLPVPTETESILSGDGELKPGETPNVEGFELNADEPAVDEEATEAPAAEVAPAAEATETPAE
ncbi:MAG: hypothetical protein IKU86_01410, partial [Thermoguttaceae bacterium]|nr:hypothetical protein [Thermoguttaceae bacterium]